MDVDRIILERYYDMITQQDLEDLGFIQGYDQDGNPADSVTNEETPAEKMQREIDEWFPNGI